MLVTESAEEDFLIQGDQSQMWESKRLSLEDHSKYRKFDNSICEHYFTFIFMAS